MAEQLDHQTIKKYAIIFAQSFQEAGIFGGASSGGGGGLSKLDKFKEAEAHEEATKRSTEALKEYAKVQDSVNSGKTHEKTALEKKSKLEKILQKDSILLGQSFVNIKNKIDENGVSLSGINNIINDINVDKLSDEIESGSKKVKNDLGEVSEEFKKWASSTFSNLMTAAPITAGVIKGLEDFRSALKYGSDMNGIFNVFGQSLGATALGLSGVDWNELEAQNRRLSNSFGNASEMQKKLIVANGENFGNIGDLASTTKFTTQMFSSLSKAGIDVSKSYTDSSGKVRDANTMMAGMTDTFNLVRAFTGETFEEMSAKVNEYVTSEAGRMRLLGKSSTFEKADLLRKKQATKALVASFGLTGQEAEQLANQFDEINGMDPKERYAESFKLQSVAASMGVENAELLGKAARAGGIENLSEGDREKALKAQTELSEKYAKSQTGNFLEGQNAMNSALFASSQLAVTMAKNSMAAAAISDEERKKNMDNAIARKTTTADEKKNNPFISGLIKALPGIDMLKTAGTTNALLLGITGILLSMKNGLFGKLGKLMKFSKNRLKNAKGSIGKGFAKDISKPLNNFRNSVKNLASNTLSKTGAKVGPVMKNVGGTAKNVASNTFAKVGPVMKNVGGTAKNVASNTLSKTGAKVGPVMKNIGGVAKGAGMKMLGKGTKFLAKAAGPIGLAVTAGMAVMDGIEGWNKAAETFGVKASKVTTSMKASSAIGSAISGASMGLLDAGDMAKGINDGLNKLDDAADSTIGWFKDLVDFNDDKSKKVKDIVKNTKQTKMNDINPSNLSSKANGVSVAPKANVPINPTDKIMKSFDSELSKIQKTPKAEDVVPVETFETMVAMLTKNNEILEEKFDKLITGTNSQVKILKDTNLLTKNSTEILDNSLTFSDETDIL